MKDVLLDFLITERGIVSFPKSDGRIEVPQNMIKTIGWNKCKVIFIKKIPSGLLLTNISSVRDIIIGKITVSCGRVRIPAKILRSVGLNNKNIILTCEDNCIIARANNVKLRRNIAELLDSFCDSCKCNLEKLVNVILNNVEEFKVEEKVEEKSIEEISSTTKNALPVISTSAQKELKPNRNIVFNNKLPLIVETPETEEEPYLLLLERHNQLIFRPVGMPCRFLGYFLGLKNELVLFRSYADTFQNPDMFYLIPGMKKISSFEHQDYCSDRKLLTGFLLVNERTYGGIAYAQKDNKHLNHIRDLIFMYKPFSPSMYKVYKNPPCYDLNQDEIDNARLICKDPIDFINKIFRTIEQEDASLIITNPPPLTFRTLENFKCKPKIG